MLPTYRGHQRCLRGTRESGSQNNNRFAPLPLCVACLYSAMNCALARLRHSIVTLLIASALFSSSCSGTAPNFHGCLDAAARALPYCNVSLSFEARVQDLRRRLTLVEKIAMIAPQPQLGDPCGDLTAGAPALGLPGWSWLVETNSAVNAACLGPGRCATTFSGPLGFGASFNRTLWHLKGSVLGTEMRAFANARWHRKDPKVLVTLTGYGPNINIVRDPRFGRNSELVSEDPLLSGAYATEMVRGMQEEDTNGYPKMLAYLKHFTAYSTEANRGHDTYNISARDLWETYLAQYETAFVEGRATGAMCSYNAVNGAPSCANAHLLNRVIRGRWGRRDAHICTDCGAVANLRGPPVHAPSDEAAAAFALNNGTDLEMGSTVWTGHLLRAVQRGLTTEAAVDAAWRRGYLPHFRAGRFDPLERVSWAKIGPDAINSTRHQRVQYEAALQSLVLLKNLPRRGLPLRTGAHVAVLGPLGHTRQGLLSDYAGDQQCFEPDLRCIPTIAEAIAAANAGGRTVGAAGVGVTDRSTAGVAAALALGAAADVIVLVLGIDKTVEHEGQDRADTALPGQQEPFAKAVLALGRPVVLVLCNGGALAIDGLIEGPVAIVEAFSPAVMGPTALAHSVFGAANRWGKLPVTMYPHAYITEQPMTNYDMAKAPGRTYKYYAGRPLFPFGHGLSLTSFSMQCSGPGPAPAMRYRCRVQNAGPRDGDEVLMVFHRAGDDVRARATHPVPVRSLVQFQRVSLRAGAGVTVVLEVGLEQAKVVDEKGDRVLYPGRHSFIVTRGHGQDFVDTFEVPRSDDIS